MSHRRAKRVLGVCLAGRLTRIGLEGFRMQNRQFGARAVFTVGAVLAGLSASGVASAAVIYGVSNTNNLVTFNSATPGTIDSSLLITGMQPGETTIGLDFRPANEQLYALGSFSRLYT